jgi:hypothetical protein
MLKDILPFLELKGQFDKLTDRGKNTPVPELAEGAAPAAFVTLAACAF